MVEQLTVAWLVIILFAKLSSLYPSLNPDKYVLLFLETELLT
jgi:hypothetical protein